MKMGPVFLLWTGLVALLWVGLNLNGCAGLNAQPLGMEQALDVPFFPDRGDQCGPSVLASVLSFWDHPVDLPELKSEIYLAHLKGSLPMDLLLAAQKRGLKAHLYSGDMDDLKNELKMGHPLIVFMNLGFDSFPIGHYVVVTGYDSERQELRIHSGPDQNKSIPYKRFVKSWDKTLRLTLLILPPDRDKESPHAGM
ncbi:MAG: hypothetical protein A3A86_07490 [Elusimicrobia bacterium RIFCSPLOWO2_01_FULL_60_11]|nr:MAG: hypothetical protein A3A86_07490 [Elusimicrobia bacterium RIFCSPLOWO2_01_FULL_60_11]